MRLRALLHRLLAAFPRAPARRWDLITEAMTKPFGGGGRGAVRDGGVVRKTPADAAPPTDTKQG